MSQIILDFGSGNTCKNEWEIAKKMIESVNEVDTRKHEIILKWQLFKEAGKNVPLSHHIFECAYWYAKKLGYQTTASVFDKESLALLLKYDVPFIKIANNRNLDWLIGEVPKKIPVYVSVDYNDNNKPELENKGEYLICVSKYPANITDYEHNLFVCNHVSDHTTNWDLFNKYKPDIYECHFKLEDSTGLDAGEFARTPNQLKEIL